MAFPFGGICDRSLEGISFIFYHDVCKFICTHNAYTSMSFSGRFCKQVMKTLAINSDVIHMVSRLFHIMVPSFVLVARCFFFCVCVSVCVSGVTFEMELYLFLLNIHTYVNDIHVFSCIFQKIMYYTRLSPSGKCMPTFHGLRAFEKNKPVLQITSVGKKHLVLDFSFR